MSHRRDDRDRRYDDRDRRDRRDDGDRRRDDRRDDRHFDDRRQRDDRDRNQDRYRRDAPRGPPPPRPGGASNNPQKEINAIKAACATALTGEVECTSNFFQLLIQKKPIYRYSTSYEFGENADDVAGEDWKQQCQEEALYKALKSDVNASAETIHQQQSVCVCTGQLIYSAVQLPIPEEGFRTTVTVNLMSRSRKRQKVTYVVALSFDGEIDLTANQDWLVINNIVDHSFKLAYEYPVNRKLLAMDSVEKIGDIILLHGVSVTATLTSIGGKPTPVAQIMPVVRPTSGSTLNQACEEEYRRYGSNAERKIIQKFKGKKACTKYDKAPTGKPNGAVYKIIEPDFKTTASSTFETRKEGVVVNETYKNYFKTRYDIDLIESQVFFRCRLVGQRRRVVPIPSQVLHLMELTDAQKSKLPQLCSVFAGDRFNRIKQIFTRVREKKGTDMLGKFGLTIADTPLTVLGEVLREVEVLIPTGTQAVKSIRTNTEQNTGQIGFARELQQLRHGAPQKNFALYVVAEPRDKNARSAVTREVCIGLDQMTSAIRFDTSKQIHLEAQNGLYREAIEPKMREMDPNNTFVIVHLHQRSTEEYKEVKTLCASQGLMSQVIAHQPPPGPVAKMITQQVSAKGGALNWLIDIGKIAPSLKDMSSLIVGIDVASGVKDIEGHKISRKPIFVVAFVAFYIHSGKWHHYCDHRIAYGETKVIVADEASDAAESTAVSMESTTFTLATCVEPHIWPFLKNAIAHFEATTQSKVENLIVTRGSVPDPEILLCAKNEIARIADGWGKPFTYIAALRRNNTRFAFDAKKYLRGQNVPEGFVNPPRGYTTSEGIPLLLTSGGTSFTAVPGFYINGANCTRGHAKSTRFMIVEQDAKMPIREVQSLLYALCYLFPNKPDALPYPLQLKCADRYANLFVTLDASKVKTLPASLHTRMHYL